MRQAARAALVLVPALGFAALAAVSMLQKAPHPQALKLPNAVAHVAPPAAPRKPAVKKIAAAPAIYASEERMGFRARMKRWNPLIEEASKRFGVPASWLRAVMQAESGGRTVLAGDKPIVSDAGAMGLMQLMPSTYADMRAAYGLGRDPFDPHDNIMAGAAYLRFLRGKYPYPTMFAAYNDGPGNLEERLKTGGLLPEETRLYLVNVTSTLEGRSGAARSMAEFTRPNGSPILIDCLAVTRVRAPLADEYAPTVRTVVTVGKVRQGVREELAKVTAAIRARGGGI